MHKKPIDLKRVLKSLEKISHKKVTNWYKEFPSYATDCLQGLDTNSFQNPDFLANLFSTKQWPAQQFTSGHFADLSFTLFRNENFLLDLYIWNHQDTNIHDHHFSGAFKMIQGESFHIAYDFQQTKKISPWLAEGKLSVQEKINLLPGDVRTIHFANDFIHQNMHTTNPCVTLCLRTTDHPKIRLNSYYNLGMKMKIHQMTHSELKLMEGLMHLCTFPNNKKTIQKLVAKLSDLALYSTMNGQYPIFNRAQPGFHQVIEEELKRRNEVLFNWVKKVLTNQRKLTSQLTSMFKP